jgi:hypothetical protein
MYRTLHFIHMIDMKQANIDRYIRTISTKRTMALHASDKAVHSYQTVHVSANQLNSLSDTLRVAEVHGTRWSHPERSHPEYEEKIEHKIFALEAISCISIAVRHINSHSIRFSRVFLKRKFS